MLVFQLRASGTDPLIGIAAFALWGLSVVLSLAIAAVLFRGYHRGPGERGMLLLAIGLLLLTTVPELLRFGLPTFTAVEIVGQSALVSTAELLGLGIILWTVYGGRSR